MIFNIILLIILVISLVIILLIVVKKLSLVAAVEFDAAIQQQAKTKKNLLQQKFRRDCQLLKRKLGSFLKRADRVIKFLWNRVSPPKNPPRNS